MAGNCRIFSKQIWVNLLKLLFSKKTFFFKQIAQLQTYCFLAKFDLFSAIFHELASDPHIILGNRQFFRKIFWYVSEHYWFEK